MSDLDALLACADSAEAALQTSTSVDLSALVDAVDKAEEGMVHGEDDMFSGLIFFAIMPGAACRVPCKMSHVHNLSITKINAARLERIQVSHCIIVSKEHTMEEA